MSEPDKVTEKLRSSSGGHGQILPSGHKATSHATHVLHGRRSKAAGQVLKLHRFRSQVLSSGLDHRGRTVHFRPHE